MTTDSPTSAASATPSRRKPRPKPHSIRRPGDVEGPDTGWRCVCGVANSDDENDPATHLRQAGAGQLRRMTEHEKLAVLTLTDEVSPFEEQCAIDVLRQTGVTGDSFARIQREQQLLGLAVPYAQPVFDHWGSLYLRVHWAKLVAALRDGAITATDPDDGALDVLWLAASLAGHAEINLSERIDRVGWGDREAFAAAVRRRCDIGN